MHEFQPNLLSIEFVDLTILTSKVVDLLHFCRRLSDLELLDVKCEVRSFKGSSAYLKQLAISPFIFIYGCFKWEKQRPFTLDWKYEM